MIKKFLKLFRKEKKVKSSKKTHMRFGFGKKVYFGLIPCRYIYSVDEDDIFVREDINKLMIFSNKSTDAVITNSLIKKVKKCTSKF